MTARRADPTSDASLTRLASNRIGCGRRLGAKSAAPIPGLSYPQAIAGIVLTAKHKRKSGPWDFGSALR